MSDIKVKDLVNRNVYGADLFSDLESFMTELSDESYQVIGGDYSIIKICVGNSCKDTGHVNVFTILDVVWYAKPLDPVDSPAPKGALE